ncbi:MAG: hypothetical protein E6K80_12700 [Candidatus Eisenbacteria bacterium]|uniref:Uncharacterized protein n=1 Tax=Eiseniibacteriota bacterium TaxID=2212470 RepID=A0A538TZY6_UNCEI|nr:MAG: hypothetical protein E6K80_12700 [Candidatus Eisenbacteria bacterium]
MQLHLLAPRELPDTNPGIQSPPGGVEPNAASAEDTSPPRLSWTRWLAVLAGAVALLGQGERYSMDPLLHTPGTALAAYWEALQLNDADGLKACSLAGGGSLPYPGMLWAFPSTSGLWIQDLRYVPIDEDEVVVSYEVHFTLAGADQERMLSATTDLVRVHGEWRVARPLAESGLMTGRPLPTRVDI